ncbi:TPA: hypothetical protein ACH3X1_003716 [Trebouxia sp. C0004]
MAKGTKRKKAGVGIDFRRVKSKVGKKLPKAQNETDMTFKARSINLPGQSVTEDKTGLAVSQRSLTTQELLTQTTHYSEKVRKDALTGLQQVFQQHPEEVRKQTNMLLGKLAECIGDVDKGVRTALKELLANVVLPQLRGPLLGPFLPLVMAHLFSALTSMAEAVRTGALDFLELFMDAAPKQVMQNHLEGALQHFVELLSPTRRSNSVSAHSVTSMFKIVKALQSLLSKAAAVESSGAESSSANHSSQPLSAQHVTQSLFHQRCQWPSVVAAVNFADLVEAAQVELAASVAMALPDAANKAAGRKAKRIAAKLENKGVGAVLLQELMSCWTECAPGQLAAGPELTAVLCMEATLQCVDMLLHQLPSLFPTGVPPALADNVVKKIMPHMPASAPAVKPSQVMQQGLVHLNLAAAKLLSRFLPTSLADVEGQEEGWRARLLDYYVGIMEAGQVLPSRQALSEEIKQSNMPVDVCTAALQGVQGVLPFVSPSRRAALLAAVCSLSTRSAARSAVKAACLAFQQSLLDKGGRVLYPDPSTGATLLPEAVLIEWLQAIPRLLWELGSTKPATSHMALGLLHSALLFAPEGSALSDVLDGLQLQLCPLYCSLLAPKPLKGVSKGAGAVAKAGKVVLPGPLAQLPATTQELAVDLLFYYPTIHEATARTCAVVCLTDTFPEQLALRIIDVLSSRACQGDASVLVSFLVTLLLGHVSQAHLLVNYARHAHLVEAVCRAVCRVDSPDVMLRAMEPVLLHHASTAAGSLAWHGTLAAAAAAAESFKARQTGHSLGVTNADSSRPRQVEAAGSPLKPSGISPRLWAALPSVMACLSLEREHVHLTGRTAHQQQAERLVLRLLQADPLLIQPFVDALITHCQHEQAQADEDTHINQARQGDSDTVASQQLAGATMPASASEADVSDKQQQDMPQSQSAGADWLGAALGHESNRIVAAVQTILVLCEQPGLLAYLLELQHQLFEATTSLRGMAGALGASSQAGAAALRKCDSLVTVLQGLTGTTKLH